MTFDIKGTLLERAVTLADKLKTTVTEFIVRALVSAMDTLEKTPQIGDSQPAQNQSVEITITAQNPLRDFIREHGATMTDAEIAKRLECSLFTVRSYRYKMGIKKDTFRKRREERKLFIQTHWESMNDSEMASQLRCSKITIALLRHILGLHRVRQGNKKDLVSAPNAVRVNHFAPSPLTAEQKEFVQTNMATMTGRQIATKLECAVASVMQARNEIVEQFIRANWETMTDGEMGRELGRNRAYISLARNRLELRRKAGGYSRRKILLPLSKNELEKALTEEGLTLEEYGRKPGIGVTRERIRQLADQIGVSQEKKPSWYANRWGKPELGDKEWVEKELAAKGSVPAFAASLAISCAKIRRICSLHEITPPVWRHSLFQGTVQLHCYHCSASFTVKKARVAALEKRGHRRHFCGKKCFLEWAKTHGNELHKNKKETAQPRVTGTVTLTCSQCNTPFERKKRFVKQGRTLFFCTKKCHGKYLFQHFNPHRKGAG